ncbi:hypothetical protein KKC94_05315 [Patescibacteria group bacterium]|nr:hypothetical protein [Patescibacteria group bacterium]
MKNRIKKLLPPPSRPFEVAKVIVFWSFVLGFCVVTVLYFRLSFLHEKLTALFLVRETSLEVQERCFPKYEKEFEKFHLVYDESMFVVEWKKLGLTQKLELYFELPQRCQN